MMCALLPQNRKNSSARLELKKYNKYLRRVTLHREVRSTSGGRCLD